MVQELARLLLNHWEIILLIKADICWIANCKKTLYKCLSSYWWYQVLKVVLATGQPSLCLSIFLKAFDILLQTFIWHDSCLQGAKSLIVTSFYLFVELKSSSFEPNSYKQDIIAPKCFFKVVHLSQPFVLSIQVQSGSKFPLPAGPLRRYISIRLHHCALESRRLQLNRGRAREPPYLLYFQRNVFPFASTLNPYANPQKQMSSCCCCCGPDVCLQYFLRTQHNSETRGTWCE